MWDLFLFNLVGERNQFCTRMDLSASLQSAYEAVAADVTASEVYATISLLIFGIVGKYYYDKWRPGPQLKHDWEVPGIGNIQLLWQVSRLLEYVLENAKKYGLNFTFRVPFQERFVFTLDPRDLKHILSTRFDIYEKGPGFHARFLELLGHGIFNVDGEEWKVQRKIAARLFTIQNFRDHMLKVFLHHLETVDEILAQHAKSGDPIDIQKLMLQFTLDSFGEIGFGTDLGALRNDCNQFTDSFDRAQYLATQRFFVPFWRVRRFFHPEEWELSRRVRDINTSIRDIIRKRREEVREDTDAEGKLDLLSLFLDRRSASTNLISDSIECSDDFLRDMVLNFIIAGRDTTAQGLSWTFYMLLKHPDVERKALEEIESELHSGSGERGLPSYEAVQKRFKYLRAIFSETLRLYPSVPKEAKMCMKDDVLPSGYHIKRGEFAVTSEWVMARCPQIWGDDAADFRPTRWTEATEPFSPFQYPVFLAGPRTCLGQNMAYLEAITLLSVILPKYKFTLVDGHKVECLDPSISLPMKNGLLVTVQRR